MRDPYSVLGVKRDAGPDEIKAAWRTKAKSVHPDQNRDDPDATSRFAEVGQAYDILKDPGKRSRFDERLKRADGKQGEPTFQEKRDAARQAAERAKQARANAEQVMEELLKAEAAKARAQQKASASETPEEAMSRIFGAQPEQQTAGNASAGATGTGSATGAKTSDTASPKSEPVSGETETGDVAVRSHNSISAQAIEIVSSFLRRIRGQQTQPEKAPDIAAIATIGIDDLMNLNWITVPLPDDKDTRFQLEPGAGDGDTIRLKNQGLKLQGMQRGDAVVTLRINQNGPFRVQGSDIHTILPVNLQNAVLGFETTAESPSGPVEVTVPAWTSSDQSIRIAGRGLPKAGGGKGDLVVEVRLMLWEKPDAKVTDLMRSMKDGLYL